MTESATGQIDDSAGPAVAKRSAGTAGDGPGRRELLVGVAHLAGLWAIAVAQPLFDVLGNSPEFFVARGNTAGDILILVAFFIVVPPLVFLAIEFVATLIGRQAYRWTHLSLVTLIAAVFFVQVQKQIYSDPTALMVVLSVGLGALVAYGLERLSAMRNLFDILAFAPVVVVALFLLFSGVSTLVLPQDEARALGGAVEGETPVVVLIYDEFPAATLMDENGEIRENRYPGFAALARESTWYVNGTSVADFSGRAVPAILTGTNPTGDLLPIAADQPFNIFTLLGDNYDLNVEEYLTQLCPPQLCTEPGLTGERNQRGRIYDLYRDLRYVLGRVILPPAIAETLPNVSTTFGEFGLGDDDVEDHKRAGRFVSEQFEPPQPGEMAAFLDDIPAHGRSLSLIHMALPHEPFRMVPDGTLYNHTDLSNLNTANAAFWAVGPDGIATAEHRHQLQTGYADLLVRAMMSRLKSTGVWDEALVIVTADHGVQFDQEVTRRIASEDNFGGVANVPFFVKYPGRQEGEIATRHARTIDLVPTIADVLDVEDMYETEGVSLLGPDPEAQITIRNARGEMIVGEVEEMIRQREAMIAQTSERIGEGGLYELGPRPELLGEPAPPVTEEIAELHSPELWEDVDLEAERLPLFVTGDMGEGVEPGTDLAIAVNGEVAATTRVFVFEEQERFAVVFPPQLLREGFNQIGIYEAAPDGELIPLGGN